MAPFLASVCNGAVNVLHWCCKCAAIIDCQSKVECLLSVQFKCQLSIPVNCQSKSIVDPSWSKIDRWSKLIFDSSQMSIKHNCLSKSITEI